MPILLLVFLPLFALGSGEPHSESTDEGRAILLDVSSHQGSIQWKRVARRGVRGVYHKLSEGEDFRDPAWSPLRQRALRRAGIPYGFYHFVRPQGRSPLREARWFSAQARRSGGWGSLMPALDVETTKLGPRKTARYVAGLIRAMRRLGQPRMLLYTSPGWWRSHVAPLPELQKELRFVRGWVAHWGVSKPQNIRGIRGWVLHQYTAQGRVPGIRGPVDINRTPRLEDLRR